MGQPKKRRSPVTWAAMRRIILLILGVLTSANRPISGVLTLMGRFADVKTPSISRIILLIAAQVTGDLRFFGWPIYGHRPTSSRMHFGLPFHSAQNRELSWLISRRI